MKITTADVARVAALANLEVPEEHRQALAEQLSRIVEYVGKLNELDTDEVGPTTLVVRGELHSEREDAVEPRQGSAEAGAGSLFAVPRVIRGR